MKDKKRLGILLIISIIIIIIASLGIYELRRSEKDIIEVGGNTQTGNNILANSDDEENNELAPEHIIVVLPNENNETPDETNTTDNNTQNNNSSNTSDKKYYIKVNNQANVVTIYTKDSQGEYTVPYKAMICSTGTDTPTSGTYTIKLRWKWLGLFGNVYGYYTTQIVGNILFHSVPYLEKGNPGSLEYWEYDKLGTSCSMGCIRLTVADAKWIYENIPSGTIVEFYSSSNPGPLGKPYAQKISGNETCRGWDPTDPDSNNPWHTYTEDTTNNNQPENEAGNNEVNNNETNNNQTENNQTSNNETGNNATNNNQTNNNQIGNNQIGNNEINNNTTDNNTTNDNTTNNNTTNNNEV